MVVGTSCSLLHVPYDLELETRPRPGAARSARVRRAEGGRGGRARPAPRRGRHRRAPSGARSGTGPARPGGVRARAAPIRCGRRRRPSTSTCRRCRSRRSARSRRPASCGRPAPPRPRAAGRAGVRATGSRAEIERVIRLQERLGPRRARARRAGAQRHGAVLRRAPRRLRATRHGWVQSYGSRCTRPPILHGDVRRPAPITVRWARYAQSLTDKPVKGMLTGPVTIVAWSFVRDDLPLRDVAGRSRARSGTRSGDLEAAGHLDHPGRRAGAARAAAAAPRRAGRVPRWAVGAYRLATSGAARPHADPHAPVLLRRRPDLARSTRWTPT